LPNGHRPCPRLSMECLKSAVHCPQRVVAWLRRIEIPMAAHRRYYRRSRMPESKFCELAKYFAQDLSATEVAKLTGLTRKSVTSIFLRLRRRIAEERERSFTSTEPAKHSDDALSCTHCFCGRCRKQLSRNTPLFGLLTEGEQVVTTPVPDCRKPILRALIRGRITPRDVSLSGWHGFDALIDAEYPKPYIVEHDQSTQNRTANQVALRTSGHLFDIVWKNLTAFRKERSICI
jgi:transposase